MNNYAKKEFSVRLGKLRAERNLSQQALSDQTGILRETIAKYETASRAPSLEDLVTLANFFLTTTDYLLGLTDRETLKMDLKEVQEYTGLSQKTLLSIRGYYQSKLENIVPIPERSKEDPELFDHIMTVCDIYDWLFGAQGENCAITDLAEAFTFLKMISVQLTEFCDTNPKPDPDNNEEYSKWLDEYNYFSKNVELRKYQILKLTEELSNHFDERNR